MASVAAAVACLATTRARWRRAWASCWVCEGVGGRVQGVERVSLTIHRSSLSTPIEHVLVCASLSLLAATRVPAWRCNQRRPGVTAVETTVENKVEKRAGKGEKEIKFFFRRSESEEKPSTFFSLSQKKNSKKKETESFLLSLAFRSLSRFSTCFSLLFLLPGAGQVLVVCSSHWPTREKAIRCSEDKKR